MTPSENKDQNKTTVRSSPSKRQASITNFIRTTPSKKPRVEETTSEEPDNDIAFDDDLVCDDLSVLETFDWDDEI